MYSEDYVSIGWPELGDLNRFEDTKITEMKAAIKKIYEEHYSQTPQVIGRWTSQVTAFLTRLKKGTIVIAADGGQVLGIGRITGNYQYREEKDFHIQLKQNGCKLQNKNYLIVVRDCKPLSTR